MKRVTNVYERMCNINEIKKAFDEVCRNTDNRKKVFRMKNDEAEIITKIYNILERRSYKPGEYVKFTIYEPKERLIVSQGIIDKVINHLIAREILYPAVLPRLLDCNVASRKNKGTKKAIEYRKIYDNYYKMKYGKYYILKADISKFFPSIDHEILKQKLRKVINDKDAINILERLIDSNTEGIENGVRAKHRRNDKSGFGNILFK